MKQLFLTSSADQVMADVVKKLLQPASSYKLAFINTAAEAETGDHWWVRADKDRLVELGFEVDEFSIAGMNQASIEERIEGKNGIFVCGGNTFYLLDQVIKTGFDEILRRKIDEGMLFIGSSAGSMIVGKKIDLVSTIDDKSKAPDLKSDGLGIVDLVILPHWGSMDFKEEYSEGFEEMYREDIEIVPLSNSQYVYVDGDRIELVQVQSVVKKL